jgi:hypothetical protein
MALPAEVRSEVARRASFTRLAPKRWCGVLAPLVTRGRRS